MEREALKIAATWQWPDNRGAESREALIKPCIVIPANAGI